MDEVTTKVQGLKEDLQAQLAAMERGQRALEAQAAKLNEVGESPEALFDYMQSAGIDPAKIAELGGEPEKVLAMLASSIGGVDMAQVAQIDDTLQKLDDLHLQVDHLARDRPAMAAVAAQVRQATAAQSRVTDMLAGKTPPLTKGQKKRLRLKRRKERERESAAAGGGETDAAFVSRAFVPRPAFQGAVEHYVFKTGPSGLGYYREAGPQGRSEPAGSPAAPEPEPEQSPDEQRRPGPAPEWSCAADGPGLLVTLRTPRLGTMEGVELVASEAELRFRCAGGAYGPLAIPLPRRVAPDGIRAKFRKKRGAIEVRMAVAE